MTRREEFGACYAHSYDGSSYAVDRAYYEPLKRAWMKGEAFCEVRGLWGQPITIKLARIEGISDFSPDQIATSDADAREQAKQDAIEG